MLKHTFFHIPGIGRSTERRLWENGVSDWDVFSASIDSVAIAETSRQLAPQILEHSRTCLDSRNHQFFSKTLGLQEAWRAFPDFRDKCVYLDIETDGGWEGDSITMVGLYDGNEFRALIRDVDLHTFPDVISHYGMIVTFFGSGFDLPMLQKRFWGLQFDQIHLDLCPTFKKLGIRGGLKKIEKQLGIARGQDTDGLDGRAAIRLWREFQEGSKEALELLIAYNREDVVNMERLAEICYKMNRDVTLPQQMELLLP